MVLVLLVVIVVVEDCTPQSCMPSHQLLQARLENCSSSFFDGLGVLVYLK